MAVEGAIAERVRGQLPVTWDMLVKVPTFGEAPLRAVIDTTKEKILGANMDPSLESTLPLIVIDYLAKLTALELITPAIDAWRNEPTSVVTTGTNEQTSFSDPIEALQQLRKNLLEETRKLWPLVAPLIDFRRVSNGPRPAMNTIDDEFLTPSPQEFPRPYRATERS